MSTYDTAVTYILIVCVGILIMTPGTRAALIFLAFAIPAVIVFHTLKYILS